jgi:hypothetical protein
MLVKFVRGVLGGPLDKVNSSKFKRNGQVADNGALAVD